MGRIGALTLAGGKLSEFGGVDAIKQLRIWVHPHSGDDYYYEYKATADRLSKLRRKSFKVYKKEVQKATAKIKAKDKAMKVEKPLAVVWDKQHGKYREVVIDAKTFRK